MPRSEFLVSYRGCGEQLPRSNVDANAKNQDAQKYAHSGISQSTLIEEVIAQRMGLIHLLKNIGLNTEFSIGDRTMTIHDYIAGQCEHDAHHMAQIHKFLLKHS
jgi:hypothetical protein